MFDSVLYKCKVGHYRKEPVERSFTYNIFMWYLNLDQIPYIVQKLFLVSKNKPNYYTFKDKDHLQIEGVDSNNLTDHIKAYVKANGETNEIARIMLLTNLTTLGYLFNPVSFYFCFDRQGNPLCAIAEVGNTYRETKPYFIGKEHLQNGTFRYSTKKLFYVSPFIDHDIDFYFELPLPTDKVNFRIDDHKNGKRLFSATLNGKQTPLSNKNVLISALQYPLVTLKIIALIHYQAFLLWLKKVHHHKKKDYPDLQVGVYNKYKTKE